MAGQEEMQIVVQGAADKLLANLTININKQGQHALKTLKGAMSITVRSDDDIDPADRKLRQAKTSRKAMEDARMDFISRPLNTFLAAVKSLVDEQIKPIREIENHLDGELVAWDAKQKEKERKEKEKVERERREETERVAKETARRIKLSKSQGGDGTTITPVEEKVIAAPVARAKAVRTVTNWKYKVIPGQEDLVPREYCSPDNGKLWRAVQDGMREIPGVHIHPDTKARS